MAAMVEVMIPCRHCELRVKRPTLISRNPTAVVRKTFLGIGEEGNRAVNLNPRPGSDGPRRVIIPIIIKNGMACWRPAPESQLGG